MRAAGLFVPVFVIVSALVFELVFVRVLMLVSLFVPLLALVLVLVAMVKVGTASSLQFTGFRPMRQLSLLTALVVLVVM